MDKQNPDLRPPAQLIIHQLDRTDRSIPLHGDCYRIGREGPLELTIDHPAVSRLHALLQRKGRQWILQDLDSTNGLWWQGRRVKQLELRDGDVVQFDPAVETTTPSLQFKWKSTFLVVSTRCRVCCPQGTVTVTAAYAAAAAWQWLPLLAGRAHRQVVVLSWPHGRPISRRRL